LLKRIWPASYQLRLLYLAVFVIVMSSSLLWISRLEKLPPLDEMRIGSPPQSSLPVYEGEEWSPGTVGPPGFYEAADNELFTLFLEPEKSQIAVLNKRNGYLWRSNPAPEDVAEETVAGTQLENLQSPYILEYTSGKNVRRIQSNALDPKMRVSYIGIENGVQASYSYPDLSLSFVIQYVLTKHGLEVIIPDAGIQEGAEHRVFTINPLPFFGAVSGTEEEGYLFVPDGPGGLIHYDTLRPANIRGYDFPIYGNDPAHLKDGFFDPKREAISYPVFGLTRGDQAYAAIVKEGKYSANIRALPSGIVSSYHSLSANFTYREEYGRRVSSITAQKVRTIYEERVRADRLIEYRLLSGEEADYVGMAAAYRSYLEEEGMLPNRLEPVERMPLLLSIIGGGTKPKFGGVLYETATTFAQAKDLVQQLMDGGAGQLRIIIQGWQNSGRKDTDQWFPIQSGMGGERAAGEFVTSMDALGVDVYFEDFMGWRDPEYTDFSIKADGIQSIDSTVLRGRFGMDNNFAMLTGSTGDFIVNPAKAIRKQKQLIDTLKNIGVDGVHYADGPGNLLFSDYNDAARLSRGDTAFYYESLLRYVQEEMGNVSIQRGNDYSLRYADVIIGFPLEPSYDLVIDTTVPFYPIAVHGYVPYTATPGNLRVDYELDLLKSIEYGAVPYFQLTYADSRKLMDTDYDDIYSSEFGVWKDRILEEFEKFDAFRQVYHQRIVDHEQLSDGVFVTTYEDGTKVTVNYNTKQFQVTGGGA